MVVQAFQAQGVAGPEVLSGSRFGAPWTSALPEPTGELHLGPASEQQKGWKSVNVAQPFSSGAEVLEVPAAHTLEPTSITTPGAGTAVFTGSSDNPHTASSVPVCAQGPSCPGGVGVPASAPAFLSRPLCSGPFLGQLWEA